MLYVVVIKSLHLLSSEREGGREGGREREGEGERERERERRGEREQISSVPSFLCFVFVFVFFKDWVH